MVLRLVHFVSAAVAGAAVICPLCLTASGDAVRAPGPSVEAVASLEAALDTAHARLAIEGMTCASCATTARIALERAEGVYRAEVSHDSASAVVDYDSERTSPPQFIAILKKMTGYDATVVREPSKGERS
jgi:copper chaperone CopZ